jgi:hypothetical protein
MEDFSFEQHEFNRPFSVFLNDHSKSLEKFHKPLSIESIKWRTWGRKNVYRRIASVYPAIKQENRSFADRGCVCSNTANRNFFMNGFKKIMDRF